MKILLIHAAIQGSVPLYLDPGSGSMIIQMVIAAVLGLGVATRVFWKNIKGWFTKNKGTAEAELDPTEIAEPESPEEPKN